MKILINFFAKEYVRPANSCVNVKWVFWEMKTIDVDRNQPYGCVIVTSFHKMHSISSLDHLDSELLFMQKLSCLCPTCVDWGEEEECDNIKHALP